jgi:hypothetical protein
LVIPAKEASVFSVWQETTVFPPLLADGAGRPEVRRRCVGTFPTVEAAREFVGTVPGGLVDVIEGANDVAARRVERTDHGPVRPRPLPIRLTTPRA